MVAVPVSIPVTKPVVTPTSAKNISLLVQKPPGVAELNRDVCPRQTTGLPVIGSGAGLTVIGVAAEQPVGKV
jgi:hypothetical protein